MSMKKLFMQSAIFAAMAMNSGIFPRERRKISHTPKVLSELEKEKIARQYASTLHEFTIKGVKIIAPNKKAALKIYRKRS